MENQKMDIYQITKLIKQSIKRG